MYSVKKFQVYVAVQRADCWAWRLSMRENERTVVFRTDGGCWARVSEVWHVIQVVGDLELCRLQLVHYRLSTVDSSLPLTANEPDHINVASFIHAFCRWCRLEHRLIQCQSLRLDIEAMDVITIHNVAVLQLTTYYRTVVDLRASSSWWGFTYASDRLRLE